MKWEFLPELGEVYSIVLNRSDGNAYELFIDGVSQGIEEGQSPIDESTSALSIGRDGEGWRYFNGILDEISFFAETNIFILDLK